MPRPRPPRVIALSFAHRVEPSSPKEEPPSPITAPNLWNGKQEKNRDCRDGNDASPALNGRPHCTPVSADCESS